MRIRSTLPIASALFALWPAACVDISAGKGGEAAELQSDTTDGGLEGGYVLEGAGCGTDGITGVTLCLAVSTCPEQVIDKDLWPGCGYRLGPAGFDMQCVCDDELCPIGTPLTCEHIAALLESQSQIGVCASRAEGRCVRPGGTGSGGGSSAGTCNKECAKVCGGENGCLEQCGCAG